MNTELLTSFARWLFDNNCQYEPGNEMVYYRAEWHDEELLSFDELINRYNLTLTT
jgi:hypothetical protein